MSSHGWLPPEHLVWQETVVPGHRSVSGLRWSPNSRCNADWAALKPHMPCTPPPGGVEAEQRYTPGSAVVYGFQRGVGLKSVCRIVCAPPLMSPPTKLASYASYSVAPRDALPI